jgi:hypothetical protein
VVERVGRVRSGALPARSGVGNVTRLSFEEALAELGARTQRKIRVPSSATWRVDHGPSPVVVVTVPAADLARNLREDAGRSPRLRGAWRGGSNISGSSAPAALEHASKLRATWRGAGMRADPSSCSTSSRACFADDSRALRIRKFRGRSDRS